MARSNALERAREGRPEWRHLYGLGRSLLIYSWRPGRQARFRRVYGPFIKEGSVVFDIGAHVGSRARFFRKLGARVVAVEPQPLLAGFLRWLFLGDEGVEVLPLAVAGQPGELELAVNPTNPTVSTASAAFRAAVAAVPSFASVRWSEGIRVETTTLDRLIEQYGRPSFIKIDVEGMEDEVLAGLSMSVPALSFEFVPAHREAALRALDHVRDLSDYRFNVSVGESMRLLFEAWQPADRMRDWLAARPAEGPSGDIYARLEVAP